MATVNLYIETNITGIGKKKGKCIYLLECETTKGPATIHEIFSVEATKDVAEIQAIIAAAKRINRRRCDILNIYVTSEMLRTNIVYYLPRWAKRNYLKADGHRLSCWNYWKEIYENTSIYDLRVYNKRHSYSNWLIKQLQQ